MKRVPMGIVRKPHGLKGEGEFHTSSGTNTTLRAGQKVWLMPVGQSSLPVGGQEIEIEQVRKGNNVLVRFKGVPDRTALEKILPFEIHADPTDFPKLPQGQHYVRDLLGLSVVDENGVPLGRILDFYETPAQLVFTLALNDGTHLDLPYHIKFFPRVDLAAGTVTVVLPEVIE